MNDLIPELPKGVHTTLYADDLVLWCTEEYATTATYRMPIDLDKVVTWAEQWYLPLTEEKQLELSSHSLPKSNLAD